MIKLGTTTLPLAGWTADPRRPEESRQLRLAAIRHLVQEYGLNAVELTLDLSAIYPHLFNVDFYGRVADLQQELGFLCTVHLPFLWVDATSLNEPVRLASLASIRQAIEQTRDLEVYAYVLHLWGFTTTQIAAQLQEPSQRDLILGVIMAQADRSLGELREILDPPLLCIENLEDPLFEMAVPLIEKHDTGICMDVGHLAVQGIDELDFLARYARRIREVHLHDAIRRSSTHPQPRDHLALGQGETEFLALLRQLEQTGFDGPVILELNSHSDLEASLHQLGRNPYQTAPSGSSRGNASVVLPK
jgi:sugar phosphate isomerase/epimerase